MKINGHTITLEGDDRLELVIERPRGGVLVLVCVEKKGDKLFVHTKGKLPMIPDIEDGIDVLLIKD